LKGMELFNFSEKAATQKVLKRKVEIAHKLQAKVVEQKLRKSALLQATKHFSKRATQLTKLTSIAEEEEFGNELEFILG